MRRTSSKWIAIGAALMLILAACGEEAEETTSTTAAPETTTTTEAGLEPAGSLTVGLAAIPPVFPAAMDMYLAEDFGYFEKYGIDVTLRPFENGGDSARAASTGEIDVGAVPTNVGVNLEAGGGDLVAVIGISKPTWHVASTNPDINACEDLEGQTVAVDGVGQTRYGVLEAILASCGLTIDQDVQTVFIHAAPVIDALVSGQIENAVMHLYEFASVQNKLEEEGGDTTIHQVIAITDIRPDQHYLFFGANGDTVASKREALVRFVAAVLEARAALADPANLDAAAALGPKMGLDPAVAETAINLYLNTIEDYWATDTPDLDQNKIEYTIQGAIDTGNIEAADAPTFEDMVDTSIWEDGHALFEQMMGS